MRQRGLARLLGLHLRRGDEILPAEQHQRRQRDGEEQIACCCRSWSDPIGGGTGSKPDEPPSQVMGWQRASRRTARQQPLTRAMQSAIASSA